MQNQEKLREIEELGLEEEETAPLEESREESRSVLPLVQAALCLAVLLTLLLMRQMNTAGYDAFTSWYQEEMKQEIQLPPWEPVVSPTPSPAPSAAPAPSPSPQSWEDTSLQRL